MTRDENRALKAAEVADKLEERLDFIRASVDLQHLATAGQHIVESEGLLKELRALFSLPLRKLKTAPQWRHLRHDEHPFRSTGCGPTKNSGEFCCPSFNTWAPFEIVWVERLGRIAKQGKHVMLRINDKCECACGCSFLHNEAQIRAVR